MVICIATKNTNAIIVESNSAIIACLIRFILFADILIGFRMHSIRESRTLETVLKGTTKQQRVDERAGDS